MENIKEEDKLMIISIFMENPKQLLEQLEKASPEKEKVLILSEPLCDLETRERIFKDIVEQYGKNADVFIKPHPRDLLNYKEKFSEQIIK